MRGTETVCLSSGQTGKKVSFTFDTESAFGRTALLFVNKWLDIFHDINGGKRGTKKLADRLKANRERNGRLDAFVVFNDNGKLLGIADDASEAYKIALDHDEEGFDVVRYTIDGRYTTIGFTDGWLFTDAIRSDKWHDADGLLRQAVKDASIERLNRCLSV